VGLLTQKGGAKLSTGTIINKFRIMEFVDSGSFGSVYICMDTVKASETPIVMKVFEKKESWDKECNIFRTIMEKVKQGLPGKDYVIHVYTRESSITDSIIDTDGVYGIVMQMGPSDLFNVIQRAPRIDGVLNDKASTNFKAMFSRAFYGLHFLHTGDKAIMHLDIKPENILYTYGSEPVKIIDFGLSHEVSRPQAAPRPQAAQGDLSDEVRSKAKEILGYDGRARDIWAMGVTIYVALYEMYPRMDMDRTGLCEPTHSTRKAREVYDTHVEHQLQLQLQLQLQPQQMNPNPHVKWGYKITRDRKELSHYKGFVESRIEPGSPHCAELENLMIRMMNIRPDERVQLNLEQEFNSLSGTQKAREDAREAVNKLKDLRVTRAGGVATKAGSSEAGLEETTSAGNSTWERNTGCSFDDPCLAGTFIYISPETMIQYYKYQAARVLNEPQHTPIRQSLRWLEAREYYEKAESWFSKCFGDEGNDNPQVTSEITNIQEQGVALDKLLSEAAAARIVAEAEAARIAEEAEATRIANEEATRIANEAEATRIANEAVATRIANEAVAKRFADEQAFLDGRGGFGRTGVSGD
jgi:serine/threonine protein kinase